MTKRTSEQLTALFTEMGEAEVAKALSSHKWRTKAYNTLALEWLTKARTVEATEKPLERSQSPVQVNPGPKVAEDRLKAVEKHTEGSSDKPDKKPHSSTPNKPKGAK